MVNLTCPYCNSKIDEYMSTCPKCNSKLKTICSNCKKIINTNWRECPNCGQAVLDGSLTRPVPSDIPVETKTQIYSDNVPVETKTQIYGNIPPLTAHENKDYITGDIGHTANEMFHSAKKPYSKKFLASILAVLLLSSVVVIVLALRYNVNRYYDEGVSYYNQKNYDEAISNFEKVIMINP
ncbi:MAG: zinc ribbon domain-containing protein, partial [Methanofastidiosum sp.]|nr:zinc ribbon domain-containing protein [Methanofastidiosum sp.]